MRLAFITHSLIALTSVCAISSAQTVTFNGSVGQAKLMSSPTPSLPFSLSFGAPMLSAQYCKGPGVSNLHMAVTGMPFDYNTVPNTFVYFVIADAYAVLPGVPTLGGLVYLPASAATASYLAGPPLVTPPGGWFPPPGTCPTQITQNAGAAANPLPAGAFLGPVGQTYTINIPNVPGTFPFSIQAFVFRIIGPGILSQSNAIDFTVT